MTVGRMSSSLIVGTIKQKQPDFPGCFFVYLHTLIIDIAKAIILHIISVKPKTTQECGKTNQCNMYEKFSQNHSFR